MAEYVNLLLMLKDKVVMEINFDLGIFNVIELDFLPWELRNKIRAPYIKKEQYTEYDMTQIRIIFSKNRDAILSFLSHRVLPLSRENAKKVYSLFKFDQIQGDEDKSKISILCRAASLQDNYWVKMENDNIKWDDVNLRTNSLSDVVAWVSLHGSSLSIQGIPHTPELTGQGAYAKAWFREDDGLLWLYKRGHNGITESKIEVMVSKLLDNCNVEHVPYLAGESNGTYICKCSCITTEEISILTGMDFISYCNQNEIDWFKHLLEIDAESVYKMCIVDYLISNRDRHSLNWGLFYHCDTMEILGCHPLFDHNNAFDIEYMKNKDAGYQFGKDGWSIRTAAKWAIKKTNFYFKREFSKEDFLTERQYSSFMERANELGIKVNRSTLGLSTLESLTNM